MRLEKKRIKDNFSQQLTASLAHEKLNPLNSILNVTNILLGELREGIEKDNCGVQLKTQQDSRASS